MEHFRGVRGRAGRWALVDVLLLDATVESRHSVYYVDESAGVTQKESNAGVLCTQ